MALIECPECSKQVSDQAKMCPNCGYTLKSGFRHLLTEKNIRLFLYTVIPWIVVIMLSKTLLEYGRRIENIGLIDALIITALFPALFFTFMSYVCIIGIYYLNLESSNKKAKKIAKKIHIATISIYAIVIILSVLKYIF